MLPRRETYSTLSGKSPNMSVESLLLESFATCEKHDIKVTLYPRRNLPNNCAGEFEEPYGGKPGDLRVAVGKARDFPSDLWLAIYVHEYSHCLQWINKAPEYTCSHGASGRFFEWVDRKKDKRLMKDVYTIQKMESYCDRRAVRLIKRHKLDIDIDDYIRQSNAYIYFYMAISIRRSWVKKGKRFPYTIKEVLDMMPKRFLSMEKYRILPPGVSELFDKYCF